MSVWRHPVGGLALMIGVLGADGARAETLCRAAAEMAEALRTEAAPLTEMPGAARCQRILTASGARTAYCRWDYAYRAPEATARFDVARQALQTCFAANPEVSQDADVNHPDSYGMWIYRAKTATAKVSIKDKAAERRTHVFVWVEVPAP